ncbi:MAG: hypothetical protein IIW48_07380 [Clostridia bacterium]|nr:hypothetical protein [Clostridia bacterium]
MKTVRDVMNRAFALLGYTDRMGDYDADKFAPQHKQAISLCQTVLEDICKIEGIEPPVLRSIDDELPVSQTSINLVMPYGLAMWFAQLDSDGTQQQIHSMLYNQRLGSVPKAQKRVTLNYSPFE